MSKFFSFLFFFLSLISCAENSNNTPLSTYKKNTTFKMKNFNSIYALNFNSASEFQVYINDVLVAYYYGSGGSSLTLPINREILKSGKQQIKIKIKSDKFLSKDELNYYKFEVLKFDSLDDPDSEKILTCSFNEEKSKSCKEFSQTWNFIAEVPFELNGWTKSVNLLDEDKDILLKELINKFNEFNTILAQKNTELFFEKTKIRDLELDKALYLSDKESEKDRTETLQKIKDIVSIPHLSNYKMVFYGNGRLVTLLRTDKENLDESALQTKLKDGSTEVYELIFHRPHVGSGLEVIR